MAPAPPISLEIFQQGLEAARDAGQITQHDYELGSEHVRDLLTTRDSYKETIKVGGACGGFLSVYYARSVRKPPYSWPMTGALVVTMAILGSFLPLLPKVYRETRFVQSLDNANDFQRAVIRSLKAASQQAVPVADPDSTPGVPQRWQAATSGGPAATAAQSSWDAIRSGQHPEPQAKSPTPVRDALAARQRQQQQQQQEPAASDASGQSPSKDEQLEAERREWEAMMAKERELAQGK